MPGRSQMGLTGYHMTRRSTAGKGRQVLFYVHKLKGTSQLAVVGTDKCGTSHYIYRSHKDFDCGTCVCFTNRAQVIQWLASIGATKKFQADESHYPCKIEPSHRHPSRLKERKRQRMLLDRKYVSIRQEPGQLHNGHPTKNFYLIAENGFKLLAIVGTNNNARRCFQYRVEGLPDYKHLTFATTKHCKEWLKWVVGNHYAQSLPSEKTKEFANVVHSFAGNEEVLQWVMHAPNAAQVQKFQRWTAQLSGIVTDIKPMMDMLGSNLIWTSTQEAIALLGIIDRQQSCLLLLEKSRISRPVAMLKAHGNQKLAALARKLSIKWRNLAFEALKIVSKAIQNAQESGLYIQ